MLSTINPTKTGAWAKLKAHHAEIEQTHLRQLFKEDPKRFKNTP